MNSSNEILKKADELLLKVKRLTERHQKLSADLAARDEKIKLLESDLADREGRIEKMDAEVAAVKLGSTILGSDEEKKELKNKINDYIKEIDKVILNLSAQD